MLKTFRTALNILFFKYSLDTIYSCIHLKHLCQIWCQVSFKYSARTWEVMVSELVLAPSRFLPAVGGLESKPVFYLGFGECSGRCTHRVLWGKIEGAPNPN